MKATNGKCGVFVALAAVLLVTAALLISCPDPVGYQPPAGMGYITVSISEFSGERTVLPVAGTWTSYNLSVQQYASQNGAAQGSPISKGTVTDVGLGNPISLAPGYYTLTVTANIGVGAAAAEGTSTRFQISPGSGQGVSVTLKPLPYTEDDDGTFEYTIDLSSLTATLLEMTITDLVAGDATPYNTATTVTEGTDTIPLTPGAYSVFLEATVNGETASITEIVNVHQNLTSSVTFVFDGNYFTAFIDGISVSYATDDTKPVLSRSGPPTAAVAEGAIINLAGGVTETITITNVTAAGYTSMAWYCDSDTAIGTGNSLIITAGTAPFDEVVTYRVTVVGITATGAYSTNFKVSIGN